MQRGEERGDRYFLPPIEQQQPGEHFPQHPPPQSPNVPDTQGKFPKQPPLLKNPPHPRSAATFQHHEEDNFNSRGRGREESGVQGRSQSGVNRGRGKGQREVREGRGRAEVEGRRGGRDKNSSAYVTESRSTHDPRDRGARMKDVSPSNHVGSEDGPPLKRPRSVKGEKIDKGGESTSKH